MAFVTKRGKEKRGQASVRGTKLVRVTDDVHAALVKIAGKRGCKSPNDLLRAMLEKGKLK